MSLYKYNHYNITIMGLACFTCAENFKNYLALQPFDFERT